MKKCQKLFVRYLFWALTILVMLLLFNLSGQTRTQSAQLSGSITQNIVKIFYNNYDSASEEEILNIVNTVHGFIRKAAHFTAFLLIGVFSSVAMYTYNCKQKLKIFIPLALGAGYAIFDELHQYFVPGRGPGFLDVLLDCCGCTCGVLIVFFITYYYERRKRNGRE